jgi:hypothetical protein
MQITSTQLRETLSRIESSIAAAGDRLVSTDAAYNAILRAHIASGAETPPPAQPTALNAARDDLARLALTRDETRRMLAEAEKREKDAADELARAKILSLAADAEEAARLADETAATLSGYLVRLAGLKIDIQRVLRQDMARDSNITGSAGEAASRIATCIAGCTGGNPASLRPEAAAQAAKIINAAKSVAGIA